MRTGTLSYACSLPWNQTKGFYPSLCILFLTETLITPMIQIIPYCHFRET